MMIMQGTGLDAEAFGGHSQLKYTVSPSPEIACLWGVLTSVIGLSINLNMVNSVTVVFDVYAHDCPL